MFLTIVNNQTRVRIKQKGGDTAYCLHKLLTCSGALMNDQRRAITNVGTSLEHNHNQCGHYGFMVYLWFITLITRLSPGDRSCSPGSGSGWTLLRPAMGRIELLNFDIDTVLNTGSY